MTSSWAVPEVKWSGGIGSGIRACGGFMSQCFVPGVEALRS